jgi:hypothetical protein
MKTGSKPIALGLVIITLLLTIAPAVLALPPLPSSFYGTVKVDGANVPLGTIVSAWINGVWYADPATPGTIEGGVEGDTVVFHIGGLEADETGTWHSGTNVQLNLTASTSVPPRITVTKVVVGGDMAPGEFQLHVQGQDFTDGGSGTELTLTEGAYEVTEDDYSPAYTTEFSTGCSGTAEAGDELECTVTNTRTTNNPPTLSGLPDQIIDHTTSLPATIDLWTYASDAETPVSGLTYTIEGTPPAGAGVTIVGNRYVHVNPSAYWCGYTDVTIRVTDPGGLWDTDTFRVAVTWSCLG